MGRSFLSVKLAAAFGLLVAGAVMAQQELVGRPGAEQVPGAAIEHVSERDSCGDEVSRLVHTPRATVHAAPAARAARS